jgi:glycolate oxidase FAD binding subunit
LGDSHAYIPDEPLIAEIIQMVGKENVTIAANPACERPYKLSAVLTVTPVLEDQVAQLLQWASVRSIHWIPQGGGTKDAFGLCSTQASIILSMQKLSGILHHSVGDLIVTVLPGTTLRELQEVLERKGQFLPLDPSWSEQATLGGIVAANGSGPKRALYGSVRDHLIASRVACADGKIIRTGAKVVKNVAGYDMNKLFIGAMGTLGVFTELTFKIRPLPASCGLLILSAPTLAMISNFQTDLMHSNLEPCALELVNAAAVEKFLGVKQSAVFVLFEDVEPSVQFQIHWVRDCAKRMGLEEIHACFGRDKTEPAMEWLRGMAPNANDGNEEKTIVGLKLLSAISDVPNIVQFLESVSQKEGFDILIHGGLYTGISYISLTADGIAEEEIIHWIKGIRDYLEQRLGYAVVEFASQRIRSVVSIWGDRNEGVELMRGIKHKFDPAHVLNSGRFAGGV